MSPGYTLSAGSIFSQSFLDPADKPRDVEDSRGALWLTRDVAVAWEVRWRGRLRFRECLKFKLGAVTLFFSSVPDKIITIRPEERIARLEGIFKDYCKLIKL